MEASMQPSVVLVDLPGVLRDIVASEIRKDAQLRLAPTAEVTDGDRVIAVGIADSPLQRMVATLSGRTRNLRVIAICEHDDAGDVFRFEMIRVASNASPHDLLTAIRAAAFEPWDAGTEG